MVVYTVIITIIVLAYGTYKAFSLFNTDSVEAKLKQAEKELQILRKNYNDVLNQKIDTNNPGAGGMPGGQRVESVDDL
jgi:hypothetical protein